MTRPKLYGYGPGSWRPAHIECLQQPAVGLLPGRGVTQRVPLATGARSMPAVRYPIPVAAARWSTTQGLLLKQGMPVFYGDLRLFGT